MVKISDIIRNISAFLKKKIVDSANAVREKKAGQGDINIENLMQRHNIKLHHLELPYSIEGGKLNGKFNIRCDTNRQNEWNMALKFLLIDCSHLIMLQNLVEGIDITYNFDGNLD